MGFAASVAAVATQVANIADRASYVKDFWSDVDDEILLPAAPADTDLPNIVVAGLPSDIALTRVALLLKVRAIENTSALGTNGVNGAQTIKVKESSQLWAAAITAINIVDNMWLLAISTRESGDVIVGDNDIKATVSGNGTYNVRWISALVDLANLKLNDVQVGFRMFWEVE